MERASSLDSFQLSPETMTSAPREAIAFFASSDVVTGTMTVVQTASSRPDQAAAYLAYPPDPPQFE